jgi:hypothetical protein
MTDPTMESKNKMFMRRVLITALELMMMMMGRTKMEILYSVGKSSLRRETIETSAQYQIRAFDSGLYLLKRTYFRFQE